MKKDLTLAAAVVLNFGVIGKPTSISSPIIVSENFPFKRELN